MKPGQLITLLEDSKAARSQEIEGNEQTEILLQLLVHMFFADKRLDEREVKLLTRILPEGQDPQPTIEKLSKRELDLDRLATLFPDAKDRDDIVTLAEHAVWGDDEVDPREWDFVDKLVEKLGVSRD
jgi:uncharacterized tellurite resistance protein B-like protein